MKIYIYDSKNGKWERRLESDWIKIEIDNKEIENSFQIEKDGNGVLLNYYAFMKRIKIIRMASNSFWIGPNEEK